MNNKEIQKTLVGRHNELTFLHKIENSPVSEFVAVLGRRRIGKTFLIREKFKENRHFFEFTGTKNLSSNLQIKNFVKSMESYFKISIKSPVKNWNDALHEFATLLQTKKALKAKHIIFFDELPWLASRRSGFIEALEYVWNSFFSKNSNIFLIVCGSSANWMIANIVNNKGGLHNRLTRAPIHLKPFTLSETRDYFYAKAMRLTLQQIAEIYMVTGGVAYYLNLVDKGESAAHFVNRAFFGPLGPLRIEFDRLFQSLFENYTSHIHVVRALAKHPHGLAQDELAKKLKQNTGGTFTKILAELEKSDFIQFHPKLDQSKKNGTYRLADEFTIFYLTWIDGLPQSFKDDLYWQKQVGKPRYNSWLGNAFETLCFRHSDKILAALGISGLTTNIYQFRNKHVEIDLIIDRSDKCINLCEMKYSATPFNMTKPEAIKIQKRKAQVLQAKQNKAQMFVTLVTSWPAIRNQNYLSVVDNEINLEKLF